MSNYELEVPNGRVRMASWLKSTLENSKFAKQILLFATMLGTSMLIGDGVLTPCISGLLLYFLSFFFRLYITAYDYTMHIAVLNGRVWMDLG